MALIPFGEYRPDVADYEGQHTHTATNVVPQGDGYGPFLSFVAFSSALAAPCRGIFYAINNDGSTSVFAATVTKIYELNNTNQTWTDVSAGGGTYSGPSIDKNWSFAQFNNFVFATNKNDAPQVFDLTSSSAFAALGGSPPQADFIAVINRFVVLSGIASPNVYRVQWSGLNATTTWTSGVSQSDFQDLADGGIVRGVTGGEIGYIFQDRSIRRMTFQPGSDIIFGIDRISANDGLLAPYSLVNASDRIFFYSPQGFKMFDGLSLTPIGKERVDRTFANDIDSSNLQLLIGAVDPAKQRVYWAYKSVNGTTGQFDKILVYDWILDRWGTLKIAGEYIAALVPAGSSSGGLTLEQVDAAYDTAAPVALTSLATSTSASSPTTFTLAAHGLTAGRGILLVATSGSFPAPLAAATPYYIKATGLTSNTFQISAGGGVGALEGAAVITTSSATSTATLSYSYILSNLDTLSINTLDSVTIAAEASLGAVGTTNKMGFFTGPTLEATIESAEHGSQSLRRIFLRGYRPITDAAGVLGKTSVRENQQASVSFTTEQVVTAQGWIPQRISTRYARAHIRITAGTTWTFAAGIEPDSALEGQR